VSQWQARSQADDPNGNLYRDQGKDHGRCERGSPLLDSPGLGPGSYRDSSARR